MVWNKCIIHSILAILSQLSLFLSGLGGIIYLKVKKTNPDSPSKEFFLKKQHGFNLVCLITGFIFFTSSLAMGFIQAKNLWGSYWSWDVKQIGSAIMWLYYLTIVFIIGWHGFIKDKKTPYITSLLASSGIAIMGINVFVLSAFSKLHNYL